MVTFVGAGAASQGKETSSYSVLIPAGVQVGDTLLLIESNFLASVADPAGWTLLGTSTSQPYTRVWSKTATATDTPGSWVTIAPSGGNTNNSLGAFILAYRGVDKTQSIQFGTVTNGGPPAVATGKAVLGITGSSSNFTTSETGSNFRQSAGTAQSGYGGTYVQAADWLPSGAHTAGPVIGGYSGTGAEYITVVLPGNDPPVAPAVTVTNAVVGQPVTARWTPSDPDGDAQAKAQVRYRKKVQ